MAETAAKAPFNATASPAGGLLSAAPPTDVLVFYCSLVAWVALLASGVKNRSFGPFLVFGNVLLVFLNLRYFLEGPERGIAFFVALYDMLHNLGAGGSGAAALATCADNSCSSWSAYRWHPSWGVSFYNRFSSGNAVRETLLLCHIAGNSLAFLAMTVNMFRPGYGATAAAHKAVGYFSMLSLLVGVACACLLASEHGPIGNYGGERAKWGFYSMATCVYTSAAMGMLAIWKGDVPSHRRWMFRYAGSMWGSFWLFRVMEFLIGPLLRGWNTASILLDIWASAPLGILLAEAIRVREDSGKVKKSA
ncbi:putative membrane protein [Hyaloraphidium curvatum]|nr:putative membrane protein [Hyaloraphidium curvatum]